MGRIIRLREEKVYGSKGDHVATVTVTVDEDVINFLLSLDLTNWKPGVDVNTLPRGPQHVPPDRKGKREKLKLFGYPDSDLDVLEREGVI